MDNGEPVLDAAWRPEKLDRHCVKGKRGKWGICRIWLCVTTFQGSFRDREHFAASDTAADLGFTSMAFSGPCLKNRRQFLKHVKLCIILSILPLSYILFLSPTLSHTPFPFDDLVLAFKFISEETTCQDLSFCRILSCFLYSSANNYAFIFC